VATFLTEGFDEFHDNRASYEYGPLSKLFLIIADFIKAWTDVLPTEYVADIHKTISPRLHKDFIRVGPII
jgi:hypothetical protein